MPSESTNHNRYHNISLSIKTLAPMTTNSWAATLLLLATCQLLLNVAHAFLPSWVPGVPTTSPELNRYTSEVTSNTFDCRFSIGLTDAVFPINDFQFRLCKGAGAAEERVSLPGSDGPRPQLSSGPHRISTIKDGSFVTMGGLQTVPLTRAAWELIWKGNSQVGYLICGFHLEHDARRNDHGATLPAGNIYVTFPVWSKKGLEDEWTIKKNAELKCKEFERERDDQLKKYNTENNLLKKAMHFRNAVQADVDRDNASMYLRDDIPTKEDVLDIGSFLNIVKTGTVWTKLGNFHSNDHKLLGSASIRSM